MKRTFSSFMIVVLAISLCSCSKQDLADMTTSVTDDYAAIVWGDKTYVPYGALSAYEYEASGGLRCWLTSFRPEL